MNDTPVEKCCEKCHGYEEYCSYCKCHTTEGTTEPVKYKKMHDPDAEALRQAYEGAKPPKGDVNIGWSERYAKIADEMFRMFTDDEWREKVSPHLREIKDLIRTELLSARAEEQKHFIDLGFEELNKAEEKGRAEERERVVVLCEELRDMTGAMSKTNESSVNQTEGYRQALSDLLTRMRGNK